MPETDLDWALKQYRAGNLRRDRYVLNTNYYDGDHRVPFATDKWRNAFGDVFRDFHENICSGVIDALADRLQVTGFKSSEAKVNIVEVSRQTPMEQSVSGQVPGVTVPKRQKIEIEDPHGEAALEIWKRNQMDVRAGEVHEESLKTGDGYVIVWPDEQMRATIWPNFAIQMGVQYDPNNLDMIRRASKIWYDEVEDTFRLNIYLPTHIEKYRMKRNQGEALDLFVDSKDRWGEVIESVNNPYGTVPVFHFPNRNEGGYGKSELKDVIPIQDGLNKSDMDMMIAMEFASFKQRYVIGLDAEIDEETGEATVPTEKRYGVDRLQTFSDPETKVGQFDATDLTQFLKVQDKLWASGARVSGTPLHYFLITSGDFPSGEAMKAAEARFIKRIVDRQMSYGSRWGKALLFALRIEGSVPEELEMGTLWKDATPRTEAELADTAVKKQAVGVSRSQILKEMGYDDETIERMLEETDAHKLAELVNGRRPDQEATNPNGQPRPGQPGTRGVRR